MNKLLVFLISIIVFSLVGCSDSNSIQLDKQIVKAKITKLNDNPNYHSITYDRKSPIALDELQNIFEKSKELKDGATFENPDFNLKVGKSKSIPFG